jgi:transcriptional regulator with XRE-family HTH domain
VTIHAAIAEACRLAGISRAELCRRLGCARGTLAPVLAGTQGVGDARLARIMDATGCSITYLGQGEWSVSLTTAS